MQKANARFVVSQWTMVTLSLIIFRSLGVTEVKRLLKMAGLFIVCIIRVGDPQSLILINRIIERPLLWLAPLAGRLTGRNGITHDKKAAGTSIDNRYRCRHRLAIQFSRCTARKRDGVTDDFRQIVLSKQPQSYLSLINSLRGQVVKGSGRIIDSCHRFLPRFRQNVTLLTDPIDNCFAIHREGVPQIRMFRPLGIADTLNTSWP